MGIGRKFIFFLITAAVLIFCTCDNFGKALVPFIDYNTGSARGLSHIIHSQNYHNEAEGFVAIPPGEVTMISIPLHNPIGYDLQLSLVPTRPESKIDGVPLIELNEDKTLVTIRLINPARYDEFDMTLQMIALGRPMIPYAIPKMQARYLDCELYNFSVKLDELDLVNIHTQDDPLNFSASVSVDTTQVWISFEVHEHVRSFSINDDPRSGRTMGETVPVTSVIPITVTADSGEVKTYRLHFSTLGVSLIPTAVDFTAAYGYADASQTVTINNTGTGPVIITGIALNDGANFTLSGTVYDALSGGAYAIPAGSSAPFTVQAIPGLTVSATPYTDNITLTYAGGMPGTVPVAFTVTKADGAFVDHAAIDTTYTPTLTLNGLALSPNYAWVDPSTPLNAGNGQLFAAVYTDPSGNYNAATGNITVNVAKAAGAAVGTPTLVSRTSNTIIVTAVPLITATGQEVEYAISTSDTADPNSLTWGAEVTFSGLLADTTYYAYARSKSSANYEAGTPSVSLAIKTNKAAVFRITGEQIKGDTEWPYTASAPLEISISAGDIITFTLADNWETSGEPINYDSIKWSIPSKRPPFELVSTASGTLIKTLTIAATDFEDGAIEDTGLHTLFILVVINDEGVFKTFSHAIEIKVEN